MRLGFGYADAVHGRLLTIWMTMRMLGWGAMQGKWPL
jgi:hypothetical protein